MDGIDLQKRSRFGQEPGDTDAAQTFEAPRRFIQRLANAWKILANRVSPIKNPAGSGGAIDARPQERDLPSAFQWASAVYRPKPYDGPIALLLSQDVIGMAENPSREWRELASKTTVHSLPGSHLECITEHVEMLAKEIQKCLRDVSHRDR